jgi:hypothetical protein
MSNSKQDTLWIISAIFLVAVVLFGLRWSSEIMSKGPVYDEQYITEPIHQLINDGWSVETAIDFEETKGPAMIWPYAFFGKMFGGTLNDLRLVSVWCSIFGLAILLWIAVRSAVYRKSILLVAIGWLVLPYNIVFSEIVMGEVSFLCLSLLAVAAFIWGIEKNAPTSRRYIAPVLYGTAIAIALHSRIHVVALAGGICFTAYALQGKRSWPWWLASVLAGLLRIPLWMRWGGLVSPEYQSLHGLGFRVESLSYLAAALAPFVGVFLITGWQVAKSKAFIIIAFTFGVLLMYFAMPNLIVPETIDFVNQNERFQGIVASITTRIHTNSNVQQAVLAILGGLGLGGLVGLWYCREKAPTISRITFWSLTIGWFLYALTRGFVFDRFLLTWAFLLPIVWVRVLPKWLLALQYAFLAIIAGYLAITWLY